MAEEVSVANMHLLLVRAARHLSYALSDLTFLFSGLGEWGLVRWVISSKP